MEIYIFNYCVLIEVVCFYVKVGCFFKVCDVDKLISIYSCRVLVVLV